MEAVIVHVPPCDRVAFLAERRALSVQRFDTVHSPHYDRHWGAISATHADFAGRLARRVPAGGQVLDAACGTGKYWPALLAAGCGCWAPTSPWACSAGPAASTRRFRSASWRCKISWPPRTWLGGLTGCCVWTRWNRRTGALARRGGRAGRYCAHRGAFLYDGGATNRPAAGRHRSRQVPGEVIEDGGYHYYPSRPQVRQWLDTAGFTVAGQADDGEYWHLLLTRR
jgi:hypothetical protein